MAAAELSRSPYSWRSRFSAGFSENVALELMVALDLPRQAWWRIPLVALAVFSCYCFDWKPLRYIVSEVALEFARVRGFPVHRVSYDTIIWNDQTFRFGIACTLADVFCGIIPLIWAAQLGFASNIVLITRAGGLLMVVNLSRRCLTDFVFSLGVPWIFADEVVGGLTYFIVWAAAVTHLRKQLRSEARLEPELVRAPRGRLQS